MDRRIACALPLPVLFALAPLSLPAESRIERTLKLDPGGRFALDTEMGSVTVTGTDAPGARLVVTSKRRELDDLLRFTFREDPRSVSVTARRRGGHVFPTIACALPLPVLFALAPGASVPVTVTPGAESKEPRSTARSRRRRAADRCGSIA
ncbi:MAG TPA: hypothetical protein VGK86_01465 [Thermoanaerobaculia bacterium]|jgi:hypothetical protein